MALIFTCQAIFLQNTVLHELYLTGLSSVQISSGLLGLFSWFSWVFSDIYCEELLWENKPSTKLKRVLDSVRNCLRENWNGDSTAWQLEWCQTFCWSLLPSVTLDGIWPLCATQSVWSVAGTATVWWQGGTTFCYWFWHKFSSPNDEWKVTLIGHLQQMLPKRLSKNNVDFYLLSHWKVILKHVWALTLFLNIFSRILLYMPLGHIGDHRHEFPFHCTVFVPE